MNKISVSSEHQYNVYVGINWKEEFHKITKGFGKVFLIAPAELAHLFQLKEFIAEYENVTLHLVSEGEAQKTISSLEGVWDQLADARIGRQDALVAFGGGATSDLSGFAAATWLRGVQWFAFPTTLAAAVDAAVGGKTGINSGAGKNLIGSFHSPSAVFIDTQLMASLSDRDFAAGLVEVIKTGFIADEEILSLLSRCSTLDEARQHAPELISRSVAVKARVVSSDFKEGKLREILNYGHTLGHAIEKAENFTWRHGEAVAIGLVFAAELSQSQLGLSPEVVARHRELLTKFGLPMTYPKAKWSQLLEHMRLDKKARASGLRFIGLVDVGTPEWLENVNDDLLADIYERIAE